MVRVGYSGTVKQVKASMSYYKTFGEEMAKILGPGRKLLYSASLGRGDSAKTFKDDDGQYAVDSRDSVNLVSSLVKDSPAIHFPAIDIDSNCFVIESQTPGHFHLYFDKALTYDEYEILLSAMTKVGLVEQGFYESFLARKATYLRLPPIRE